MDDIVGYLHVGRNGLSTEFGEFTSTLTKVLEVETKNIRGSGAYIKLRSYYTSQSKR